MKAGILILSATSLVANLASAHLSEPDTTFYGRVLHHGGGEPHVLTSGHLTWRVAKSDGITAHTVKADLTAYENGAWSYSVRVPRNIAIGGMPEYSAPAGLPVLSDSAVHYRNAEIRVNGHTARLADPAALTFSAGDAARADFIRVDLIVDTPLADTDSDGLPDWWETKYGLDPQSAAFAGTDTDNDGLTDLAEYRAGTDPSREGTAPLLRGSLMVAIPESGRAALVLKAEDSDSPASQLRCTLQSLPAGVSLSVRDGMADGRTDRSVVAGSTFTMSEVNEGRVYLTASATLQDAEMVFSLVDEVPDRTPATATLQLSTVSLTQLADAARLRPSVLPAAYTLHSASASSVGVAMRAPSSPADFADVLNSAAYSTQWQPRHGADESRLFLGSDNNDTLLGSGESDVLAAGAGENSLRGYAGADQFTFTSTGVQDTVADFSAAEKDVLDVSALLQPGAGALSNYLSLQGGVLRVDANGDGSGYTDATITLTDSDIPANPDDAWDAGLIDAGSIVPRTTLFLSSTAASEENLTPGSIIIRRRGDASQPLTVALTFTGTASAGLDYLSLPGSITFAAGQKTVTLPVTPLADDLREPLETVTAALATNPGYDLASSNVSVSLSDLPSRVWLEVAERTAYKDSLSPAQVLLRRSGTLGSPLTALIGTGGRATPAVDYRRLASSFTFAAGQDVLTLDITPLSSASLTYGCEEVVLTVNPDTNYLPGISPRVSVVICDRPQTLAAWTATAMPGSNPDDPAVFDADTDGDGFNGLMEFALNLDPSARDTGEKTQTRLVLDTAQCPGLEFRRRPGAPEIRYEVWQSADLKSWQPLTDDNSHETSVAVEADGLERVQRCLRTKPAGGKVYLRLKVVRQ